MHRSCSSPRSQPPAAARPPASLEDHTFPRSPSRPSLSSRARCSTRWSWSVSSKPTSRSCSSPRSTASSARSSSRKATPWLQAPCSSGCATSGSAPRSPRRNRSRVLAEQAYARARPLAGQGILAAAELDRVTAELAAARAREDLARVELDRTAIRAPFDGVLGRAPGLARRPRHARHRRSSSSTPSTRLKLVFTLPEMAVGLVRAGRPADAHGRALPERDVPRRGVLRLAHPRPAEPPPPPEGARAESRLGACARALRADQGRGSAARERAASCPAAALVTDAGGTFVWKVAGGRHAASASRWSSGSGATDSVEVVSGLAPGDRIVSAGTHKVVPGAPLRRRRAGRRGAERPTP